WVDASGGVLADVVVVTGASASGLLRSANAAPPMTAIPTTPQTAIRATGGPPRGGAAPARARPTRADVPGEAARPEPPFLGARCDPRASSGGSDVGAASNPPGAPVGAPKPPPNPPNPSFAGAGGGAPNPPP